jgi:CubicO group peptidase (beta-lactamase class C family)
MRTNLFLLFTVFFVNFSYAQPKEKLKENIQKLLTEQKLSGAVWVTVSNESRISVDAVGYKNIKTKEFLSVTDKVHVGSVCKTILAAGFLRMATLGLLNLNDPIQKYLPTLTIKNEWKDTNPITIKHLLDHTSGLTDAKLWHIFSTKSTPDTPLEVAYLNSPEILVAHSKPGSVYSYSNLGYTILGVLIEKVTQTRYEKYLDDNVLKPLGMSNSSFHFVSQTGKYGDENLAYGHFDNGEPVSAMPMYLRPAGQFTTTAEDMGKFLYFMMSDGTINGKSFIKIEYLSEVGIQKETDAYNNGVPFGDALGAYSRDRYGVVGIAKNGNTLGFSAMIYLFPMEKKAFFIAHNMDSETANYDLFNEMLVNYLGLTTQPFITIQRKAETELSDWEGYYVPVFTKVEPFGLLDNVFSHTQVRILGNGSMLLPFQGKMKTLMHQGNYLFSMNDRTKISHSFYKSDDGTFLITDGVKTIKKVNGLKILGIASSLLLGLLGILYLLVVSFRDIIVYKFNFIKQPILWVFIAILTLLISFVFIANQSFLNMGDATIGNILLAFSSMILPVAAIATMALTVRVQKKYLHSLYFWATIFVIQFCGLLSISNLLPIIMWK